MSARRFLAGAATASLAASTLALIGIGSAVADPGFEPAATDVIGVGSDTTQIAVGNLANGASVAGVTVPGYNEGRSTGRLVSWDATGSAQITPYQGATAITRPNGSGKGKDLLHSTTNNPDIDFARSSSTLNATEVADKLWQLPFALDELKLASATSSHAPASLTKEQIVGIYSGTFTTWSQVGGTSDATIKPLIPQTGSGTRSFFEGELKALNGGTAVKLGPAVSEVQEHDPAPFVGQPDVIGPFSVGRAEMATGVRLLGGALDAKRAVYDVVREADLAKPEIQAVFGESGFVCSTSAKTLIEAGGLKQLASVADGGVCGEATQAPATDFDLAYTPVAADVVGVGSDTTQISVANLARGYNATSPSGPRLVSFDATGGGRIQLRQGAAPITRPNGSGKGLELLHGTGDNPDVDFARSSSALGAAETADKLWQIPFALDELRLAASAGASNAPATLTKEQVVGIYSGAYTTWSQVGGTSTSTIKPLIPQTGSGTRKFFESELKALNAGNAVKLAPSVVEVQEHDATPIKDDPDAIAPFSVGRAELAGTVKLLGGALDAKRAVYNVVREADLASPVIQAIFGEGGYVCSPAAAQEIRDGGLTQLASTAASGVCGEATQAPTTDFTTSDTVVSETQLAARQVGGSTDVTLSATVAGAVAGSVEFLEVVDGARVSLGTVEVAAGSATLTVSGARVGAHTYVAVFTPAEGAAAEGSESSATITVTAPKAATTATIGFSPSATTTPYGRAHTVSVAVRPASGASRPTGTVSVRVTRPGWTKTYAVALSNGVARAVLPTTLAVGRYTVSAAYNGSTAFLPTSAATKVLTITKAAAVLRESYVSSVKRSVTSVRGSVTVAISGSSLKPAGQVWIYKGTRLVAKGNLVGGRLTVTLTKLARGRNSFKAVYKGSSAVSAKSSAFTITRR